MLFRIPYSIGNIVLVLLCCKILIILIKYCITPIIQSATKTHLVLPQVFSTNMHPFIYPPTMFDVGRGTQSDVGKEYFPINYLCRVSCWTPPHRTFF
jgi:hypothetical protein